ncbi:MAG TPA: hypothetical protein VNZ94_17045 [Xanthobacteraceae bacterium]|nr:hypothetical protein [Xanthobacteraceae bacterium]
MKTKRFLCALALFSIVPSLVQGQESFCADVYATSVANVSIRVRQTAEHDYLWNKHCEKNGELRQESTKLDLTIPIKAIVVGFSGSNEQARQRMTQFCKENLQERLATSDGYDFERTIVIAAQKSFNECRALELAAVRVSHAIFDPTSVVIRADFDPTKTNVSFRAFTYDPKAAVCRTTALSKDGKPTTITDATQETGSVQPFSVICKRIGKKASSGAEKFERFLAALVTNHGTYSVELPAEEMLGFDLATQNKQRQGKMLAEIASLNNKLAGVTAETHLVRQGQYAAGGYWEHVLCPQDGGDLDAHTRGICRDRTSSRRHLLTHSGNRCGYNYYAIACINK